MIVYGGRSETTDALAARLQDVECGLRWGGPCVPGAINGMHLLNGLEQLRAFTANGVPTVAYTTDTAARDNWLRQGHIVLGRKVEHTQGLDIVVPGESARYNGRWQRRDFWTIYHPSVDEWRVHIWKVDGEYLSIGRGKKVQESGLIAPDPRREFWKAWGIVVRSRRMGWRLRHDIAPPEGIRDVAKQAVAACGYDMGAVDILVPERGVYKVLEVNSRPAMRDDYTLRIYAQAIRKAYSNG